MSIPARSPAYPAGWERTALTRDGAAYLVRPIRADDAMRERAFIMDLSPESRYSRLMSTMCEPSPALVRRLVTVDYRRNMAFLALVGAEARERIIGIARYSDDGTEGCEFAVAVMDDWQARGVAAVLSELLFDYARGHGVHELHATMLATNAHMIGLAHWLGMETRLDANDSTLIRASCRI